MFPIDWQLLDRYLAGDCNDTERERVERWIAADAMHRHLVDAMRDAVAMEPSVPAARRAAIWASLERELSPESTAPSATNRPRVSGSTFKLPVAPRASWLKLAAAIALMVGATATAKYLYRPTARALVDDNRVVKTERGVRATLRLPDGSQVVLGVASVLRFPRVFPGGRREVDLSGQAYFTVQHEGRRPFVVRAGNLIATDLGTEFSVRAYPDDPRGEVVVTVGSVALTNARGDSASGVVHPGQLGRLTPGGAVEVRQIDADRYLGWTRGWLEFESTPLREALGDLSRWYDLDFRLSDSTLGRVPLTARLGDQPDAIDGLVASLGMRLLRRGRTITLYPAISPR